MIASSEKHNQTMSLVKRSR